MTPMITMRFMLTLDPKLERLAERFVNAIEEGTDYMSINEQLEQIRAMQQSDLQNQAEVKEKLDLLLAVANEVSALRAKVEEQDRLIAQLRENSADQAIVDAVVAGQQELSAGLQRIEDTLDPSVPTPAPLPSPETPTSPETPASPENPEGGSTPPPVV